MQQIVFPITAPEATDSNRFGPKAANLVRMGQAGLPIPDGFCVDAEAYRAQIRALGLEADARGVFSAVESPQARRHALMMKLGLLDQPIAAEVLDPLLAAWRGLKHKTGALTVVRSSALVEGRRIRPRNGDSSWVFSRSQRADGAFLIDRRGGKEVLIFGKSSVTRPRGSGLVLLIRRN